MKPETKRNEEDGYSPFNLSTLKHAIETIDGGKEKEKTMNLAALSAGSRKMKQSEKCERKRGGDTRKKNKKKLMVGMKPETNAELQRWFSNLEETFKQSLTIKKINKAAPIPTLMEPQICQFNTDFTLHHCAEAFM